MLSTIGWSLALAVGLSAPWEKEVNRSIPWQVGSVKNEKKRDRLADYFNKLNPEEEIFGPDRTLMQKAPDTTGRGFSLVVSESSDESELDDLPWSEYRKKGGGRVEKDLLWPVARADMSSGFGMRAGRVHEGVDLRANAGTEIRATASGKVVKSAWMRGYGRIVVLYHGDGLSSVYAHNKENLVQTGDWVVQGQGIAKVGSSGRSRGAHLHFEIREEGKAVNPLKYFFQESPLRSRR